MMEARSSGRIVLLRQSAPERSLLMLFRFPAVLTLALCLVQIGYGQNTPISNSPPGETQANTTGASADVDRSITLKGLIPNIIEDQKQIYWTFPGQLARGKHWMPFAGVLAVTGVLIAADQFDAPYFRHSSTYNGFNRAFSGTNAALATYLTPLALYGGGLIAKDSYAQKTALLAGEALADSEILDEVLKLSTRRARPSSISPDRNFADTWFDSKGITEGGFPSGHTIAAFSVATVFSERYGRRHRWVPYVAYGLAGAIGFSRMSLSAHFPSDVFLGAALGYAVSHFAVLHSPQRVQD
jgi:membrane-associated phospholipid phosphatase